MFRWETARVHGFIFITLSQEPGWSEITLVPPCFVAIFSNFVVIFSNFTLVPSQSDLRSLWFHWFWLCQEPHSTLVPCTLKTIPNHLAQIWFFWHQRQQNNNTNTTMANLTSKIQTSTWGEWHRGWLTSPHRNSAKRRLGLTQPPREEAAKSKPKRTAPDYNNSLIRPDAQMR